MLARGDRGRRRSRSSWPAAFRSELDADRGPGRAGRHGRVRPRRRRRRRRARPGRHRRRSSVDGDRLTCLTFTDLSAQKAQDREIARLSEAQAERMADLQDAQAALTRQATHDALTGLPNRALLVDRIDQALSRREALGAVHRRPLRRPRPVQAGQRHARATPPATPCCGGSPSSWSRSCDRWTPSPASAATSSSCSRPTSTATCTPST